MELNKTYEGNCLIPTINLEKGWHEMKDLEGEKWASCSEFDGYYEVSNLGRVKSLERMIKGSHGSSYLKKSRILKAAIKSKEGSKCGYYFIVTSIDGKQYTREVHRLVAREFVSRENGMIVHINHNFLDNRAANLKLANCQEKNKQAYELGGRISHLKGKTGGNAINSKPITAFTLDDIKIKIFTARIEAVDWLILRNVAKVQPKVNIISAINKAAKGITKTSYGYKWKD